MIKYEPLIEIDDIKELFPDVIFDKTCGYGAYKALDDSGNTVMALIRIDGRFCEISNIVTDYADKLLTEGLLRAALNFAGNRGAYIALCSDEKIADVLTLLGFTKKNGTYEGEIPVLLMGSCCKH